MDTKDARYRYYLGLAQLAQPTEEKKASARYSFERGYVLEAKGLPHTDDVLDSLERVQGPTRQHLEGVKEELSLADRTRAKKK